MPKRSREEKLAAYSQGAKRGYRSRKAFVKANGLKMKEPSPGEAKAQNGELSGLAAGRSLGNEGPVYAELTQKEPTNHGLYTNQNERQGVHR
jgi:hypothetical protein